MHAWPISWAGTFETTNVSTPKWASDTAALASAPV